MTDAGIKAAAQILSERYNRRLSEVRDQQQRATTIAAVDGVLLGLGAGLTPSTTGVTTIVALCGLAVLVAGLVAAACALWPRHVGEIGELQPLNHYESEAGDVLLRKVVTATHGVLWDRQAETLMGRREHALWCQLVLAAVGAVLLAVAAVLPRTSNTCPSTDVACFADANWLSSSHDIHLSPPRHSSPVDLRNAEAAALAVTQPADAGGVTGAVLADIQTGPQNVASLEWVIALAPRGSDSHVDVFVDAMKGRIVAVVIGS